MPKVRLPRCWTKRKRTQVWTTLTWSLSFWFHLYKSIWYILRSATFAISSCTTCLFEMHAPLTLLELSLSWKRLLERNNSKMEGMKASPWQTCFYFWRERADLVTGHWSSRNLWRGRCFRAALTVYSELHELWATSRNGHPDWIFLFELRTGQDG